MMLTPLGRALIAHRAECPRCTLRRYCGRYVAIARDMTATRTIYAGSVAPHTVLSVREDTAT